MRSEDFQHFVDHFVVSGRRLFAWGWAAHSRLSVGRVALRIRGEQWETTLPCSAGQARPDVAKEHPDLLDARSSGYVVTGFLPGTDPREVTLVVDFEDGLYEEADITPSVRQVSGRNRRLAVVGRLVRGGLRRIRERDFRGLARRVRQPQAYAPASFDDPANRARLIAALRALPPACIVLDNDLGGGSNQYRRTLVSQRVMGGQPVLLCTYQLAVLEYRLHAHLPGEGEATLRISSFAALEHILQATPVAEIFVNSPVSFDDPLGLAHWLARMRQAYPATRLTLTAHDFFAACPSFVLLDADNRYCGVPSVAECQRCLSRHQGSFVSFSPPSEITRWRGAWGAALAAADEVRSFSANTRDLLLRAYPSLAPAGFTVVPHDMTYFESAPPRLDASAPLVIGIVGEITVQKGAQVVRDLLGLIDRRGEDIRVVVLGDLVASPRHPRLTVTGPYERGQLVHLIERHGVNMFLFPSIWPETFSYVVGELTHMGVPIVAFDLGAPAERLRSYAHARLCSEVSAAAALEALIAFHRERVPDRVSAA